MAADPNDYKIPKATKKKKLKIPPRWGGTPTRGRPTKFGGESCVLSEKDRQVIKTTPARLWSRARQRLVETDHILLLPSKQSRLHCIEKKTKRNDHKKKTEIGVAGETFEKKNPDTKKIIL